MRKITKPFSVPVDGKPRDFRLTKLDAFSGASLLRLMARLPEGGASVEALFSCLSDADLRSLMTVCLKLTMEEAVWTLEGFFGGGDSKPPPVGEEGR